MPDFIEPQLAKLVSAPPKGSDWVHEIKFDGYRMQAHIANPSRLRRAYHLLQVAQVRSGSRIG